MPSDSQPQTGSTKNSMVRRRDMLATTAGVGSLLVAGCSGGGDGGGDGSDGSGGDGGNGNGGSTDDGGDGGGNGPSGRLSMLTPPPGTTGQVMGNGLMSTITQQTQMTGSAQAGSGSQQNIVQVMRGEADLCNAVTTTIYNALERNDPFDAEFPNDPLQVMSFYITEIATACKVSDSYEYVSDLSGEPITVGPQSTSFEPAISIGYSLAMDDYTPAYHAPNNMASALTAGDVEASIMLISADSLPPWVQEVAASNDLRLLDWREENAQAVRDDPGIAGTMKPNDFWGDNISEFVGEDETFIMAVEYALMSSAATSSDRIYTMLNTFFEQREQLPDIHRAFNSWTDPEFWTELTDPRIPFHPGAARFLQEQDLWSDEFTEADV